MNKLFLICLSAILLTTACKDTEDKVTPQPTIKPDNTINPDSTERIIEIKTKFGTMYMWLYKETPLHRANFLKLAETDYYDNTTFHRCIANFMIQGGDPNSKDDNPNNDGQGGPGYTIPAEINSKLKHARGEVAAARLSDNVNPSRASSGSQFYISVSTSGTKSLDGLYTVFGKVLKGIEVADSIVIQPQNSANRPLEDIKMDVNVVNKTHKQLREEFNFYGYN
jgi:cyclophilin family peptidyl-prolyl cis-trans isomerase